MGKLSSLKPRLNPLGSRLSSATPSTRQEAEAQRYRERDQAQPWRQWYGSARWKALRAEVWRRDSYICQRTGTLCIGKYPEPNSPVADHKIQHRGDEKLFWDINNLQTVSKAYHDSEKQKEERAKARW